MNKVVISILHYGNANDTKNCLNSLLSADTNNFFVTTLVIDNGTDIRLNLDSGKYKKIHLRVIRSDKNLGFTGGHNLGLKIAQEVGFDYFLILNNDLTFEKSFLNELIIGEEKAAATVPKIYFSKGREFHKDRYGESELGKIIWYAGGYIDWDNVMSKHIGIDEVDHGQYELKKSVDFATGACLLLRREIIDKIGLFDEKYFLYFEDADLSMRIIGADFRIFYCPKSIVWHSNAGSSGVGSELHDYYLSRNRLLFGFKYAPLRSKIALLRESMRLITNGRKWQKKGIIDFCRGRFGEGSYEI